MKSLNTAAYSFAGFCFIDERKGSDFGIVPFVPAPVLGMGVEFIGPQGEEESDYARQAILLKAGATMEEVGMAFIKIGEVLMRGNPDEIATGESDLSGRECYAGKGVEQAREERRSQQARLSSVRATKRSRKARG